MLEKKLTNIMHVQQSTMYEVNKHASEEWANKSSKEQKREGDSDGDE